MQSIMSLWKDKIPWTEELNAKYFNKGSSHKIQASTCGFDSCVLRREKRMKSYDNFPSSPCWLCKKPAWVHMGTEHYYSLVLEHVFRGSPGPVQPFCQPQSCPITILPTAWSHWLLGLAVVPRSHHRKLNSFLDIHPPSLNWHIGIYQKIQGLKSWWKVIIGQPSTAAWNKLKSWPGASVWGQTRGVALSLRCSKISDDRNCPNPSKIQKGKGKGRWGWGASPTSQSRP